LTIAPWLIWLLPIAASAVVPMVALINEGACKWFAAVVSGLAAGTGVYQALTFTQQYSESLGNWAVYANTTISLEVKVDGLAVILSTLISFLSFVIVLYAVENMKRESGQARFYSLVLLFIGAMLGLVMAGNLIQLYFFWEVVGICSALLIAFWNEREAARKAGLKAFVVTRFGDIALLIAVVLILATLHTTNLDAITSAVEAQGANSTWVLIGVLVLVGAMGKSAQVPLHVWLPDAMEGPTPVSALIHAATMVNAGVYLIVRFSPVFYSSSLLSTTVLIIGLLSLTVGAVCACAEKDLKRILAYSTISQLGLMFTAVGLGSASGAIYQLISQGLFKALAFMAAGSVIEALGTRNIEEMGGLARAMKYTYVAFLFSMLSMVGLPPLMGFWTKDTILSAALSANGYAFLVIALASILTAFYSFRALIKVFHVPKNTAAKESPPLMIIPMMVLVVSVIVGWLVLSDQTVFLPSLSESLSVVTSSTTVFVLFVGLAITYIAFLSRREATKQMIQTSALLRVTLAFLVEGLGFDKAYAVLERSIAGPLVRGVKTLQSGVVGNNIALLLSALVVLIVLIATGVI
jgi:NADH-quinone oxidoreductase subunit L